MTTKKTGTASRYGSGIAAVCATLALTAHAGEPLTLQMHWLQVPGSHEIKSGRYEEGVERLEARADRGISTASRRTAVLIDLCVGYIMSNQIEKATTTCDEATTTGWYRDVTYNNRGVLNLLLGRHDAAIQDFSVAVQDTKRSKASERVASTNQRLADEQRMAATQQPNEQVLFAGTADMHGISPGKLQMEIR